LIYTNKLTMHNSTLASVFFEEKKTERQAAKRYGQV